jgi:ABC-type phosphate transport system permease subunit
MPVPVEKPAEGWRTPSWHPHVVGANPSLAIPIGIISGITCGYAEASWRRRWFAADTLNGVPSIVIGVLSMASLPLQAITTIAGGMALAS